MTPKAGKAIAWCSFALGIAVSVAGNILHSAITPAGLGELVGAAFWPLALMLSIEILTRVRWQSGKRWMAARVVGLFLVGIVAAVLSYRHLAGLMTSWGEDAFNAHLGPLAVDGLMLLAATALLSISREPKVSDLPEELQGTPEEISAKAFDRGVAAQQIAEKVTGIPLREETDSLIGTNAVVTEEPDGSVKMTAKTSKLHIVDSVDSVSESDAEEAARQAFIQSLEGPGKPLSAAKVAEMMDVPRSTAHRKYIQTWRQQARRIERG